LEADPPVESRGKTFRLQHLYNLANKDNDGLYCNDVVTSQLRATVQNFIGRIH